jgi:hypothetical protein
LVQGQLSVAVDGVTLRVGTVENARTLRILSDRNRHIPRLTDRSPHAPKRQASSASVATILDQMLYYPVVDIRLNETDHGRLLFDGGGIATASFAVNGHFNDVEAPVRSVAEVPSARLEHWENAVFVEGGDCSLVGFSVERDLSSGAPTEVELLSTSWSGRVEALDEQGRVIASSSFKLAPAQPAEPQSGDALSPRRLAQALEATIGYVLRSINDRPASPTGGGMFLFYDHDARTFRSSHWNWTWGPAIRLLLDSRENAGVAAAFGAARLERAALGMGRASLRFQIGDPAHPADGFVMVRWSPGLRNERTTGYLSPSSPDFPVDGWAPSHAGEHFVRGFEAYVSPADALFLAGWGWLPLYKTFGDAEFLSATERMVSATRRLLDRYEIIPQDMPLAVGKWTDYTREEAGFGMVGLGEYARLTGSAEDGETGRRYIDQILDKLERPDGLWNRHWWRSERRSTGCEYKSRSLGWATMGLIAAHEMAPGLGYLDRARRLAAHFVELQHEPGYWGLVINKPIGETEISIKGTSLWASLFYRLYELTADETYLAVARRALSYLVEHQYLGSDPDGHGGLVSCSAFSGVDYRRWFRLSCGYSSSFFGLALLSELRIQEQGRR